MVGVMILGLEDHHHGGQLVKLTTDSSQASLVQCVKTALSFRNNFMNTQPRRYNNWHIIGLEEVDPF